MDPQLASLGALPSAVRNSVAEESWYAALALALALPDICSWIETSIKESRARYVAWCVKYLEPRYVALMGADRVATLFLSGSDTYALRCAFLHNGMDESSHQKAREAIEKFDFTVASPSGQPVHMNMVGGRLQLQVDLFCLTMCDAVDEWMSDLTVSDAVGDQLDRLLLIRQWQGRVQL